MEVIFNEEELKLIEDRGEKVSPPGGYVPEDRKDKVITIGLKVSDVAKVDLFLEKLLNDDNVKDQIGAECVHVDLKTPISREIISNLQNSLNTTLNDAAEGFNKLSEALNGVSSIGIFLGALANDTIQEITLNQEEQVEIANFDNESSTGETVESSEESIEAEVVEEPKESEENIEG